MPDEQPTSYRVDSPIGPVMITPEGFDRLHARGSIGKTTGRYSCTILKKDGVWYTENVYGSHGYGRRSSSKLTWPMLRKVKDTLPGVALAFEKAPDAYDKLGRGMMRFKESELRSAEKNLEYHQSRYNEAAATLAKTLEKIATLKHELGIEETLCPDSASSATSTTV